MGIGAEILHDVQSMSEFQNFRVERIEAKKAAAEEANAPTTAQGFAARFG